MPALVGSRSVLLGQPPSSLLDGLVEYWNLDEASGTRAGSHAGLTLTDNNTVGSAAGPGGVGTAASFVTASSEYLSRADSATLRVGNQPYFISTWVYLTDKAANRALISKEAASVDYSVSYNVTFDRFLVESGSAGTGYLSLQASTFGSPSTGTWYPIVVWYDKVAATLNICVNNGVVDSVAVAGKVPASSTDPLIFGGRSPTPDRFLNGRMGPTGLWIGRTPTAAERTKLYNSGFGLTYAQLRVA